MKKLKDKIKKVVNYKHFGVIFLAVVMLICSAGMIGCSDACEYACAGCSVVSCAACASCMGCFDILVEQTPVYSHNITYLAY